MLDLHQARPDILVKGLSVSSDCWKEGFCCLVPALLWSEEMHDKGVPPKRLGVTKP